MQKNSLSKRFQRV